MSTNNCGKCNESGQEEYSPKCCQYDSSQIIYRLNSDALSALSYLGIGRGDSLEFIIEKMGKHILDSNPNFVESFQFEHKDLKSLFENIFESVEYLKSTISTQQKNIEKLQSDLITSKNEINKLKQPSLVDSKGLGFTKYSELSEVLQKIIDYGL